MGQREHEAGLVGIFEGAQKVGLLRIRGYEEAREVVLVVLDGIFEHLQTVHLGSLGIADGSPSAALVPGDICCCSGCVFGLNRLQLRMIGQKVAALHQRHRVGVYLLQRFPRVVGQAADAVAYVQPVLSHHRGARLAQKLVVVEQRAGNGILDGEHCYGRGVATNVLKHLLERLAADQLYLLALVVLMGCYVVERPQFALYCYSLHIRSDIKENPASLSVKQGWLYI